MSSPIKQPMHSVEAVTAGIQTELTRLKKAIEYKGYKITYLAGFSQHLAKLENALTKTQDAASLKDLKAQMALLQAKYSKVAKVVDAAAKVKQSPAEGSWASIKVRPNFFALSRKYYVAQTATGELKIVSAKFLKRLSKHLGKGGFGTVSEDTRMIHTDVVVKRARKDIKDRDVAIEDLYNEERLLKEIHQNGTIPGVVSAPLAVLRTSKDVHMLTERYDSDLLKYRDEPQQDRNLILQGFANMLAALGYAHSKNIFHGDIKLENIGLFLKSKDNPLRLGDWGGATKMTAGQKLKTGSSTSLYFPYELNKMLGTAIRENNKNLYKSIQARRDYYALGKCLVETLLPKLSPEEQQMIFHYRGEKDTLAPSLNVNLVYLKKKLDEAGYSFIVGYRLEQLFKACDPRERFPDQETVKNWADSLRRLVVAPLVEP